MEHIHGRDNTTLPAEWERGADCVSAVVDRRTNWDSRRKRRATGSEASVVMVVRFLSVVERLMDTYRTRRPNENSP